MLIGGEHAEVRRRVGEDLLGGDRPARGPERHGGTHVVGLPFREDDGANESARGRAEQDPDDHDEVHEARPEGGDEDEAEEDLRNRHRDVGGAHQDLVEEGHAERSREAPGDAEHHAQGRGAERRPERDPPAVQHAREDVPADLVGSEPVGRARRLEGVRRVDRVRPVRRQERRGDDGEHDQGQKRPRDDGTGPPGPAETAATLRYLRG